MAGWRGRNTWVCPVACCYKGIDKGFSDNRCWRPCHGCFRCLRLWNHMSSLEGKGKPCQRAGVSGHGLSIVARGTVKALLNHPHLRTKSGAGFSPLPSNERARERGLLSACSVRFSNNRKALVGERLLRRGNAAGTAPRGYSDSPWSRRNSASSATIRSSEACLAACSSVWFKSHLWARGS